MPAFDDIYDVHVYIQELTMAMAHAGLTIQDLVEYKLVRICMALRRNGFTLISDSNA